MSTVVGVFAALSWDPQVRGFLIVLVSFVILVGSVYLLLATNTGPRLGFLIAAAGFFGWNALMGWVWVMYGIGLRGEDPHWEVKEVVTGEFTSQSGLEETEAFPSGWQLLPEGNPILGDAIAAADAALLPADTGGHGGEGGGDHSETPRQPVFQEADDFVHIAGYRTGGEDYWIPGGGLERNQTPFRGPLHQPHYTVIQVRPVLEKPDIGGVPPAPEADPSAPVTTVVMERNLGNVRQPSFLFALANTIAFVVFCVVLHRRDKQLIALRAAPATA